MISLKLRKRNFKITLKDREMVEEFVNKLLEELKIDQSRINVRGTTVTITLYGTKDIIDYNWQIIRAVAKEITYIKEIEKSRLKKYVHSILQKHAGATFPLDALEEVLKAKGFIAKVEYGKTLISDAPFESILNYARMLGKTIHDLKTYTRSSSTKKFLATLAVILETDNVDEVKKLAMREGVLEENEIGHVILTMEWKQALNKILKKVK